MNNNDGKKLVSVGVMNAETVSFFLDSPFLLNGSIEMPAGEYIATMRGEDVEFNGQTYKEIYLSPMTECNFHEPEIAFTLNEVMIGVNFHWQRYERQSFKGDLKIVNDGTKLHAINVIDVEAYLFSVISSEMSATASLELLKAHAVISRSWLLASMRGYAGQPVSNQPTVTITDDSLIKWYERDAHNLFDVCADDHCQRYQGIIRATTVDCNPNALTAILETAGQVLMYEDRICDARYSKSCGGMSELFENCWADVHHNYLKAVPCATHKISIPDLTIGENAQNWIRTNNQKCFCNTTDKEILGQVLNNYDQETTDFYRWTVKYSQKELSELVKKRSGIDFGTITDLIPIQWGESARLVKLKIVGTNKTMIVGKELEIRKWLSESHLYSSAFVVDKDEDNNFTLTGAGWGHGVGLCQIGAAVMGAKGYDYKEILFHYFRNAEIKTI